MLALKILLILVSLIPVVIAIVRLVPLLMADFPPDPKKEVGRKPAAIAAAFSLIFPLVAIFLILPSFGQVPAGMRGVVLRFGAVTGEIKPEGFYVVTPFVNTIELMDVQIHKHSAQAGAASKDLQNVATTIALNYRIDPERADKVYQTLRRDYETRIVDPFVQEAVKSVTARYNAEQLITERAAVRDGIANALIERLRSHGLMIDQVSIADFKFDADFAAAIEQKMVAAQMALKADNDLKRIKIEADQRIAQAEGEARAIQIQAEAIRVQGGEAYVNLKAIEKWDGALPQWMTSGGTVPFVNVSK